MVIKNMLIWKDIKLIVREERITPAQYLKFKKKKKKTYDDLMI